MSTTTSESPTAGEPTYLVEPGRRVGRAAYTAYLYRCSAEWRRLGHPDQEQLVAARAARVERGDDDVSRAARATREQDR